jgi:hypothetical protein
MFDLDEGYRPGCRRCGPKHVLSYLRQMERISKQFKRRDMVWYYQEAWEFVALRIYGTLPPRADLSHGLAFNPDQPPLPLPPAGPRPELKRQPLRKIMKLVTRPYRTWELTYEQLECGHELLAPVGYSVPATSRRCLDCARAAMAKKKKPTSTCADAIAKAKAVGA